MFEAIHGHLDRLSRRKYSQPPVGAQTIKRVLVLCMLAFAAILIFALYTENFGLWFLAVIPLGPCLGLHASIRAVGVASEPAGKPEERDDQGKGALAAAWVYAVFALLVGFSAVLAFQPTTSPGERDLLAARVAVASRLYQVQSLCGVSASPELLFLAELGSRACLSQQAIEQVRLLNGLTGGGPAGLADSIVQAMLEKNSDACVEAFERSRQICPALFHGMPERELRALRRASLL